MANGEPFYVYRIFSEMGETVYIGKGTGRRLVNQQRRFGLCGEIVKTFRSERAAYNFEAKLIGKLKPSANKVAGGGGAITRRRLKLPRWWIKQMDEIDLVGSRRYAARMLLRFDTRGYIDQSKLELIRQVANGPRC